MSYPAFQAHVYASDSSYSEQLTIQCLRGGLLNFTFNEVEYSVACDQIKISKRLGQTPRFLDLPNGIRLETQNNDAIDELIANVRHPDQHNTFLYRIEKNLVWVVTGVVMLVVIGLALYRFGIPAFAKLVSPMVPQNIRVLASEQTLKQMDTFMLAPSTLTDQQQQDYRAMLAERLQPWVNTPLMLDFRSGDQMGANAFALPDGTIVFTDQLMALLNDDEFLAIAAHEAGHVLGDHGMRSVISSTTLLVAITLVTGDSEAISELLITAPTILMQLSYSRALETEADNWARTILQDANIPSSAFVSALQKLVAEHGIESENSQWHSYLSTHPQPEERISEFLEGR